MLFFSSIEFRLLVWDAVIPTGFFQARVVICSTTLGGRLACSRRWLQHQQKVKWRAGYHFKVTGIKLRAYSFPEGRWRRKANIREDEEKTMWKTGEKQRMTAIWMSGYKSHMRTREFMEPPVCQSAELVKGQDSRCFCGTLLLLLSFLRPMQLVFPGRFLPCKFVRDSTYLFCLFVVVQSIFPPFCVVCHLFFCVLQPAFSFKSPRI